MEPLALEASRGMMRSQGHRPKSQRVVDRAVLAAEVSKIPFFDFSFTLLEVFRKNLGQVAGKAGELGV